MKAATYFVLANIAHAALASAIPTPGHDRFHKRRDPAAPIVETVTTTFYQTVVWVDNNGKPVSTEINSPPPGLSNDIAATATGGFGPDQGAVNTGKPPGTPPGQPPPVSTSIAEPAAQASLPEIGPSGQADNAANTNSGGESGNQADDAPGGMGICYDMIDSQTKCKGPDTINQEFSFLKQQGYGLVRVYDIGCPVGDFVNAAGKVGLQLMVGINAIANLQGDLGTLIDMVKNNWSPIDTVYIGNELVNNGAASAGQVAGAVTTAKGILSGAGFSGSVVTVDTFNVMMTDPTICSTSDYCAANAHAFFDPNTAADGAGAFVLNAYNEVAGANGGKKIVITESGWPWKGSCNGKACPGVEEQKTAMNSIMRSFSGNAGNIYMFQAYNAGYKSPGPQGVEQYFGIYDTDHYAGGIGPSL